MNINSYSILSKSIISFLLFVFNVNSFSQIIVNIQSTPQYYTPLLDTLFASGTFNNWNPRDLNFRFTQNTNGTYSVTLPNSTSGTQEYKVTRGSWNNVETQLDGNFLSNRIIGNNQSQNISISNWNDMLGWHTAIGNTHIIDLDFYIPQLNRYRRIWIYLPQNYYNENFDYPVVYFHDGQNLYDAIYTAFGTEWKVDETFKNLEDTFGLKIIAVGIDNGGAERINEYSPYINSQYGGGMGEYYLQFISQTLKPFIDANFRTMPQRSNTAIIGSSMGGLISMAGMIFQSQTFAKAGIFSPSFWFTDSIFSLASNHTFTFEDKIYFVSGASESGSMVPLMNQMANTITSNGAAISNVNTQVRQDGQHSEWFWARELRDCILWLFNNQQTLNHNVLHNYEALILQNSTIKFNTAGSIKVYNVAGKLVKEMNVNQGEFLNYNDFESGVYILSFNNSKSQIQMKFISVGKN